MPLCRYLVVIFFFLGTISCIRADGLVHLQLHPSREMVFVPLTAVRPCLSKPLDVSLLPPSQEVVTFFAHLLIAASKEMDPVDDFDEDVIREQMIKLLQLKAASAILDHRECLKLVLSSSILDSTASVDSVDCHPSSPANPCRSPHVGALVYWIRSRYF